MSTLPSWITGGARFRLLRMGDDPDPVPAGSTGVIDSVVPFGRYNDGSERWHFNVTWDPGVGRSLNLAWPVDQIEPFSEELPMTVPTRFLDPAKTQPDRNTPEGRALWDLFEYVMDETPDDPELDCPQDGAPLVSEGGALWKCPTCDYTCCEEASSYASAADQCALLYDILGRFGLMVP